MQNVRVARGPMIRLAVLLVLLVALLTVVPKPGVATRVSSAGCPGCSRRPPSAPGPLGPPTSSSSSPTTSGSGAWTG